MRIIHFLIMLLLVTTALAATPNPGHDASRVGAGTFSAGDYRFPNNVNISGNFLINTDKFYIDAATGNVGITTTGPRSRLDLGTNLGVGAGLRMGDYLEINEREGYDNAISIGFNALMTTVNASTVLYSPTYSPGTGMVLKMHQGGSSALDFYGINWNSQAWGKPIENFTHVMRLSTNGSIGIGTTEPQRPLHINTDAMNAAVQLTTGGKSWHITRVGNDLRFVETGVQEPLTLEAGGNVGIGTTNPGYPLHIAGSTIGLFNTGADATFYLGEGEAGGQYGIIAWESSDDTVRLGTYDAGTSQLVLAESGNVGINDTTPSYALDVAGGIQAQTQLVTPRICLNGDCQTSWPAGAGASSGSGWTNTTTQVSLSDTNDNVSASTLFVDNTNGRVGIGDTTPTNNLDVAGAIGISDTTVIDASRNLVNIGTIDTGQGANELYDMDQNVLTSSSPTFGGLTVSGVSLQSNLYSSAEQTKSVALGSTGWIKLFNMSSPGYAKVRLSIGSTNSEEQVEFEVAHTYVNSGTLINVVRQTYNHHITDIKVVGDNGLPKAVYIKIRTSEFAPTVTWKILQASNNIVSIDNIEETPGSGTQLNIGTGTAVASTAAHMIGEDVYVGQNSGTDDDYVYFDNASESIRWEEANTWFEFSDKIRLSDEIQATQFLDNDNTAYYVNPAGATSANFAGAIVATTLDTGQGAIDLGDAAVANGDTNSVPTGDQVYDFVTGLGYITDDTSVPKNHLINSGALGFTWADSEIDNAITIASGTLGSNNISSGAVFTTTGAWTLGDNGDDIIVSASDWDVDSSGNAAFNAVSIGGIDSDTRYSRRSQAMQTVSTNGAWYRVAQKSGANGRGFGLVSIYGAGNNVVPSVLYMLWSADWSGNSVIRILGYTGSLPISNVRATYNSSTQTSYLEFQHSLGTASDIYVEAVSLGSYPTTATTGAHQGESTTTTIPVNNFDAGGLAVQTDGDVGIGTTDPVAKLHIRGGTTRLEYSTTNNAQYGFINSIDGFHINENAYYDGTWKSIEGSHAAAVLQTSVANGYAFAVSTDTSVTGADEALGLNMLFNVETGGDVGIGTSNPGYKLDVASGGIRLDGKSALTDNAYFVGAPSHGFRWNSANDAFNNVIMYDNGDMYVRGSVGIGDTGPDYKLDVEGQLSVDASSGYGSRLVVGQTTADYPATSGWASSFNSNILLNSLDTSTIGFHDASDSVGSFGYADNQFFVDGSTGAWGAVEFGINDRTPDYTLDVAGTMRVTGANTLSDLYSSAMQTKSVSVGSTGWIKLATLTNPGYAKFRLAIGSTNSEEQVEFEVAHTYTNAGTVINVVRQTYNHHVTDIRVTGDTGNAKSVYVKIRTSDFAPTMYWALLHGRNVASIDNVEETPGAGTNLAIGTSTVVASNAPQYFEGNVGIGTIPSARLDVQGGAANIWTGSRYAIPNSLMSAGSLTIGSIGQSYGGGTTGWTSNTAGLLLETLEDTEIAVHDSGARVVSLAFYDGSANTLTFGRDMGYGVTNAIVAGSLTIAGNTAWHSGNDGSGSGLDADTVDGVQPWHASNDGSGSGLDADTVDGISSGTFMRSDTDQAFTSLYHSYNTGAAFDLGAVATDYPATSGWTGTFNANMVLNGADTTSIGFHDSGDSVGAFGYVDNQFFVDGSQGSWGVVEFGINTRSPTQSLDVSGDVRIRGNDITDSGDTSRISIGSNVVVTVG